MHIWPYTFDLTGTFISYHLLGIEPMYYYTYIEPAMI